MNRNLRVDIMGGLLIFLWLYAAISKLLVYDAFRFQIMGHELLGNYAHMLAWLVPCVEIVISILLLRAATHLIGLYVSLILLLIFTFYILYMFMVYPHQPCSCGGVISQLTWRQHILFNLFFIIVNILAIRMVSKKEKKQKRTLITV